MGGQTNLDSASAPPSYEQSQFQEYPASPNHMKSPFNPNVDGAGDLRQRQVPLQQQVVVQYVQPPQFGPRQMQVQCPHCQSMVLTRIEQDTSDKAWLWIFNLSLRWVVPLLYSLLHGQHARHETFLPS